MDKRYAISDIHGNARAFLKLLDYVDPDPEQLIVLGDLSDRGLDTWGVYKECAMLVDEGCTFLLGNHDLWLHQYLTGQLNIPEFTKNIGVTTLESFKIAKERGELVDETVNKVLSAMVPYYEQEDYIFVHAAIDPYVHFMEDQKIETLVSGNERFRNSKIQHSYDQTIVFGHVPTPSIHRDIKEDDARIWYSRKARKMCIDTGAGFGMRLTMVDLWQGIAYAYDFTTDDIIEYRFKRKGR